MPGIQAKLQKMVTEFLEKEEIKNADEWLVIRVSGLKGLFQDGDPPVGVGFVAVLNGA